MRRKKTFEAITRALEDGSWHELEDLRDATSFSVEWIQELEMEGIVDTRRQVGQLLVRLRSPLPEATEA